VRRIGVAALAAVTMHVALLAIRPGSLASSYVAPAAPVMAVRMLLAPSEADTVPATPQPAAVSPPRQAAPAIPVAEPRVAERRADPRVAAPRTTEPAPTLEARPAPPTPAPPTTNSTTREARASDEATAATPQVREPKAADPPLPAAPDYAFGVRLDPGPRPIGEIEPEYPDTVRLREGVVVLRLLISDTGRVDEVGVVRSEPRGVFEQAAIEAFSKARFSPGLAAGTPVKSQITVEVQFMPINRGARVSGRTY
jgi:protein TonB